MESIIIDCYGNYYRLWKTFDHIRLLMRGFCLLGRPFFSFRCQKWLINRGWKQNTTPGQKRGGGQKRWWETWLQDTIGRWLATAKRLGACSTNGIVSSLLLCSTAAVPFGQWGHSAGTAVLPGREHTMQFSLAAPRSVERVNLPLQLCCLSLFLCINSVAVWWRAQFYPEMHQIALKGKLFMDYLYSVFTV